MGMWRRVSVVVARRTGVLLLWHRWTVPDSIHLNVVRGWIVGAKGRFLEHMNGKPCWNSRP